MATINWKEQAKQDKDAEQYRNLTPEQKKQWQRMASLNSAMDWRQNRTAKREAAQHGYDSAYSSNPYVAEATTSGAGTAPSTDYNEIYNNSSLGQAVSRADYLDQQQPVVEEEEEEEELTPVVNYDWRKLYAQDQARGFNSPVNYSYSALPAQNSFMQQYGLLR